MDKRIALLLLFIISYLLVSLLQIVASVDGILHFFGLHWIFALFAALLLLFIPAIGPLAGVYGAVEVWGWPIWASLILFFWPYILYGILLLFGVSFSFRGFRIMNKKEKKEPDVIDAVYTIKDEEK